MLLTGKTTERPVLKLNTRGPASPAVSPPPKQPPTRRPLDLRATLLVLVLCAIWGLQPVVVKTILGDVAPTMQLSIRFFGSAIFFGAWLLFREGRRAFTDGTLRSGLLLGSAFALEFVFMGVALAHTTAAHTIVFLYSAPIFTALGLQFLPEERLRSVQWAGIGLAFLGIVVAFLGNGGRPADEMIEGDLFALCGGLCWGLSNVVLRHGRIGNATTIKTVFFQVAVAAVVLLVFSGYAGTTRVVLSTAAILALLFQTLVIAIGTYLLWFWLLRQYLTSRLMLLSLLTPVFGVALGALILDDPIDARFALGTMLVLIGILIVNARQLLQRPV